MFTLLTDQQTITDFTSTIGNKNLLSSYICIAMPVMIAAVAALGIKTGRISPEKSREPSAQAVRAFLESFEARFGGLMCCELTRDYVAKSEEMYDHCVDYVAAAIELTESLPGES